MIHAADQAGAKLRGIAPVLWEYMAELVEQGFSRAEALALVRDLQARMTGKCPS